jgi:hypothetical protein
MLAPRAYLSSFLPFEGLNLTPAAQDNLINETARFVRDEVMLAPFHLRAGIVVFALLFNLWLAIARLGGLSTVTAATRWEKFGAPMRSLTRLIRSLALLYFCEHPAVLEKQGVLTAKRRQEIFRARHSSREAA